MWTRCCVWLAALFRPGEAEQYHGIPTTVIWLSEVALEGYHGRLTVSVILPDCGEMADWGGVTMRVTCLWYCRTVGRWETGKGVTMRGMADSGGVTMRVTGSVILPDCGEIGDRGRVTMEFTVCNTAWLWEDGRKEGFTMRLTVCNKSGLCSTVRWGRGIPWCLLSVFLSHCLTTGKLGHLCPAHQDKIHTKNNYCWYQITSHFIMTSVYCCWWSSNCGRWMFHTVCHSTRVPTAAFSDHEVDTRVSIWLVMLPI